MLLLHPDLAAHIFPNSCLLSWGALFSESGHRLSPALALLWHKLTHVSLFVPLGKLSPSLLWSSVQYALGARLSSYLLGTQMFGIRVQWCVRSQGGAELVKDMGVVLLASEVPSHMPVHELT